MLYKSVIRKGVVDAYINVYPRFSLCIRYYNYVESIFKRQNVNIIVIVPQKTNVQMDIAFNEHFLHEKTLQMLHFKKYLPQDSDVEFRMNDLHDKTKPNQT